MFVYLCKSIISEYSYGIGTLRTNKASFESRLIKVTKFNKVSQYVRLAEISLENCPADFIYLVVILFKVENFVIARNHFSLEKKAMT